MIFDFISTYLVWIQVGSIVLIAICLVLLSDFRKISGRLASFLPAYIPRDKTKLVYELTEEDMQKGIRALNKARPCLGYFTSERIILTCEDEKILKLNSTDTTITLIETQGLSNRIPLLLRFSHDGQRIYIACKKRFIGTWDNARTQQLFTDLSPQYTHHTLNQYKDLHKPNRLIVGGLFVACIAGLALVATHLYTSPTHKAPQVLTELTNKHVVAFSQSRLFEFSAKGDLLSNVRLEDMGLDEGVSDAIPFGVDQLLVADLASGQIKHCARNPWRCDLLPASDSDQATTAIGAFALAENPENGHLYVADTARHSIHHLNEQGAFLETVLDSGQLCFPNKVWVEGNQILVVNTNWHNIVAFELGQYDKPLKRWSTVKQGRDSVDCPSATGLMSWQFLHREWSGMHRAIAHDGQSVGNVWPIDATRDNEGHWWVLNAKNDLTDADLVKLDANGELIKIVIKGTDPIGLLQRDDDLLVADMAAPGIIQVLNGGEYFNDFGDTRFQVLMSRINDQQSKYQFYYLAGLGLTALTLVLALMLLMFLSDRRLRWIPTT